MDENEDQTTGVTGALDLAGSAANLPSSRTAAEQAYAKLAAYPEEVARAKAAQLAAGQKYINENYQGPSTSQRLWALSQALLAPRPYKGFAGTMANISQAFGNIGQQQEAAEQKRKEALFQLQQQYGPGSDIEAKGTAYKTAADLAMKQYIADMRAAEAARKGAQGRWVALPYGGSMIFVGPEGPTEQLDTLTPEQLDTLTPEQVASLRKDPRNIGKRFLTTSGRPGVIQ